MSTTKKGDDTFYETFFGVTSAGRDARVKVATLQMNSFAHILPWRNTCSYFDAIRYQGHSRRVPFYPPLFMLKRETT